MTAFLNAEMIRDDVLRANGMMKVRLTQGFAKYRMLMKSVRRV